VTTIVNVLDFGMDIGHAVDAERFSCQNQAPDICNYEGARIDAGVLAELAERGHDLGTATSPNGDWGEYATVLGIVQVSGIDPATGERLAASDPRGEWGALPVSATPPG